jgi:hypothetical protein
MVALSKLRQGHRFLLAKVATSLLFRLLSLTLKIDDYT